VLPTICYFSTFTAVMYYIGAMGYVIKSIAVVIQVCAARKNVAVTHLVLGARLFCRQLLPFATP
jgi:nucleoside permease NupC